MCIDLVNLTRVNNVYALSSMRYLYKKEFYYENLPPIEHLGVINSILTKIYSLNNGSILRTLYRGAKPGVGTSGSWAE